MEEFHQKAMEGSKEASNTPFTTRRGPVVFDIQSISDLPTTVAQLKVVDGKCADLIKKS